MGLKHYQFWEILLSKHSLSQNKYYSNLYEFLKQRIHAFFRRKTRKQMFLLVSGGHIQGHQHDVSIQSFINLGKPFSEYLPFEMIALTRVLARLFVNLSSFIFQILDILY